MFSRRVWKIKHHRTLTKLVFRFDDVFSEKQKQKLTDNLWFLLEMVFNFCWRREVSNFAFDGFGHNFTRWVSLFFGDRNFRRWVLEIWDGICSVLEMGIWWHGLEMEIGELEIGFGESWDWENGYLLKLRRRESACVKEEGMSFLNFFFYGVRLPFCTYGRCELHWKGKKKKKSDIKI